MKTYLYSGLILIVFFGGQISAQNIYIGTNLSVSGTGSLYVSGNLNANSIANYANDGTVEIKGDINNDKALMTKGFGNTKLTGTAIQTVSGSEPFVVNDITINNTSSGTSNIVLNKQLIVGANLTFVDGILESASDSVTFLSGATQSGASDSSHIHGLIEKIGNQQFTFPVGDALKLRTVSIEAPLLATDVVTCKYFHSTPAPGIMVESIDHISTLEYWSIERTNGVSNPAVTLSYDSIYSGGVKAIADLRVVNLVDSIWVDMGGSGVGASTGIITASSVSTAWGAFTLGSSSDLNPLPIELIAFSAVYNANNKGVDLNWETLSEKNSDYFLIEHSINGTDWVEISKIKATGNSTSLTDYKEFDAAPTIGVNYYRLKEIDFNADVTYSEIADVSINSAVSVFSIFPNPLTTTTTINYWLDKEEEFQLEIINALGQVVMEKSISFEKGDNKIIVDMEQLLPGNYFLKIHSSDFSKVQIQKISKLN